MNHVRAIRRRGRALCIAWLWCGACRDPTASAPFLTLSAVDLAGGGSVLGEQRVTPNQCNRPRGDLRCRGQPVIWRAAAATTLATADGVSWDFGAGVNASGMVVGSSQTAEGVQHATVWDAGGVEDLGRFGGAWAHARAVNDRGETLVVVGDPAGGGGMTSLVWQDGVTRELGHLGGADTEGFTIGAQGHVAGRSRTPTGEFQAFLWHGGTMAALPPLFNGAGASSVAVVVNATGAAAGQSVAPDGTVRAVRWQNGTVEDLAIADARELTVVDMNDAGQILVAVTNPAGLELGYVWSNGAARAIVGSAGRSLEVVGLSGSGYVAGSEVVEDGSYRAFRWRDDRFEMLGTLGGRSSRAQAIGADGIVVGQSNVAEGDLRGFMWDGAMHVLPVPGR